MKLKKTLVCAILAGAVLPVMAQYEGTKVNDRIGHGNDSIDCLNNISLFNEYVKAKEYAEAYPCWKFIMEKAPLAQVLTYTRGWTLLTNLIQNASTKEEKKKYLDDLMSMHDTRIKYVKELNSFATPKMRTSKGSILCRKAYDYTVHAPNVYDDYSLDKAYAMFTEGIELVNQTPEYEVEGYVLHTYFNVSYNKYQNDPTGFHEQFLKDYLLCKEVCEKMLERANLEADSLSAQKVVAQYDPTLYTVEQTFAASKAADRDQLIAIFTPKVEQKKSDLTYLRSIIDILANNDCDDTDVYFKASKYAYDIEPSYAAAIGVAQQLSQQGKNVESIEYYDKAIQLTDDNKVKSRIAMKVAYALAKAGHGVSTESYLQLATQFDPSTLGRADLFRAQNAAASKNYSQALTYVSRAAQEDASISGTANRLKARIVEAQRKHSEYERANAEYRQQLEKQQKLENFWKGH